MRFEITKQLISGAWFAEELAPFGVHDPLEDMVHSESKKPYV